MNHLFEHATEIRDAVEADLLGDAQHFPFRFPQKPLRLIHPDVIDSASCIKHPA
jgi:hypothetical protein